VPRACPADAAFFLAPPESALGRPLSTVILRRSDQQHPDADDARDAEMALWQSWVRSCNRCRNWSPAWRPASSPGALACESNSDHGRASFIADGCVGAAPRQSVHIISALAGTLVGQHFLLRFPRTQRPRPRLRPQPPKPPRLLALSKATKKDTRAQFAKDTPVLSRDIFSPCSKAIPSLSQPPLPSRPEYGCLSNTMP